MLKGSAVENAYYRFLGKYLVPVCVSFKLTPNHVTFAGFFLSIMAGIAFAFSTFWGGILTLLTGLLDTLDGALARELNQSHRFGAFLDSVLDRYTELFMFIGIWFYFCRQGMANTIINLTLIFIIFGSIMVSYTRARAEGLGQKCVVGLFQRGERIIFLGVFGMLNSLFNVSIQTNSDPFIGKDAIIIISLILLAVGTNLTALWRFCHVLNKLRGRKEGSVLES